MLLLLVTYLIELMGWAPSQPRELVNQTDLFSTHSKVFWSKLEERGRECSSSGTMSRLFQKMFCCKFKI